MTGFFYTKHFSLLLITVFIFCSCNTKIQPVTKDEAIALAKDIEKSIKKGESELLDNAFDQKEFAKRMQISETEFGKDVTTGALKKLKLGSQLVASLSDKDSYVFIKQYVKDEKMHIIFRLYTDKESSLNYHDFELIRSDDKCKIADAYIYTTGETLAESMHNVYLSVYTKNTNTNDVNEMATLDAATDFEKVSNLINQGKAADAKEVYDRLPAKLKKTKPVMMQHIRLSSLLSTDEYIAAIKDYQLTYPNEPNTSLLMIDGYYIQKEYDKMLGSINTLDAQINTDPILDYYRSLSYNLLEKEDSSILCLKRLVVTMPDFQKGFGEYIAHDLKNNKTKEADSLINIYRANPRFDQPALNNIIDYFRK